MVTAAPTRRATERIEGSELKQLALFEDAPVQITKETLRLEDLPPNEELSPLPPGPEHDSIAEYGVLMPVLLVRRSNGKLLVAAGNRRIKKAREVGIEEIDARVWHSDQSVGPLLTLIENNARSANEAAEAGALKKLFALGKDGETIRTNLSLTTKRFKELLTYLALIPKLWDAFESGAISPEIAQKVGKLGRDSQERLLIIFERTGTLTNKDITAEKQALAVAQPVQTPLVVEGEEEEGSDDEPEDALAWMGQRIYRQIREAYPLADSVHDGDDPHTYHVTMTDGTWKTIRFDLVEVTSGAAKQTA